jgi:hypothetical protein
MPVSLIYSLILMISRNILLICYLAFAVGPQSISMYCSAFMFYLILMTPSFTRLWTRLILLCLQQPLFLVT